MSIVPSFFRRRTNSDGDIFDPFTYDVWDHIHADFPFFTPSTFFPGSEIASSSFTRAARVDWKETPEVHMFKADLPGLRKEEVKVEVEDGNVLQISGERMHEKEENTDTWHRVERSSGKFQRRFRLPENAKVVGVKAAMENGVLTVTVPKATGKKPSVRAVEISG